MREIYIRIKNDNEFDRAIIEYKAYNKLIKKISKELSNKKIKRSRIEMVLLVMKRQGYLEKAAHHYQDICIYKAYHRGLIQK